MKKANAETLADEAFWQWSLRFYAKPEIPPVMLTLQDIYGCNVNLVLWTLWVSPLGDDVTTHHLEAATKAVSKWHGDVTTTLRKLRRALKSAQDTTMQELRAMVKATELKAEQVEQQILARIPPRLPALDASIAPDHATKLMQHYLANLLDLGEETSSQALALYSTIVSTDSR